MEVIDTYLAVFAEANPGATPPSIRYENGWFRVSSEFGGRGKRIRKATLLEMTERLRNRIHVIMAVETNDADPI